MSEVNEGKALREAVDRFLRESSHFPGETTVQSGCYYLSKNTVRECFNGFTAQMCKDAATACGCIQQFVPGGTCP